MHSFSLASTRSILHKLATESSSTSPKLDLKAYFSALSSSFSNISPLLLSIYSCLDRLLGYPFPSFPTQHSSNNRSPLPPPFLGFNLNHICVRSEATTMNITYTSRQTDSQTNCTLPSSAVQYHSPYCSPDSSPLADHQFFRQEVGPFIWPGCW